MEQTLGLEGGGVLGGELVRIAGEVAGDATGCRLALSARVDGTPLCADPALLLLAALDLVVLAGLGTHRSPRAHLALPDDEAHARVRGALLEEGLRELGRLDLVARLAPTATGRLLRFELLRAEIAAEPGERVADVAASHALVTSTTGFGVVASLASAALSTTRGRDWRLVTTTLVEPAELEGPTLEVWIEDLELRRDGDTLHLDASVRTTELRT